MNNNMNNAPTSQGEVDNQQAQAQTQADFEEWVASSQDAPPAPPTPPTPPSPATSASTAPAASASASASAETETETATSASGPATENTDVPPKKVRRTRKATPAASGEDKGKTKPAAAAPAARKPRKKKTTPEVVQEKPEQAIPTTSTSATTSAAAAAASGTTSNSTAAAPAGTTGQEAPVSISSLLTQESPPYVPEPATGATANASAVVDADEEEISPAPAPTSTSVPDQNLKKPSATSGENVQAQTEDNDAPESSSTPSTPSTPEPDGIKFERSRQIRERIDLVALEGSLLHKPGNERGTLQYLLDGERAFTRYMQQGRIIMATPQASQNDRMILGALLVAKQDMVLQGNIELTGSPAFKQRAINL
ncbi:hypothetical protein BZ335_23650, partial [Salmonella enterica subsp. enterica serovar Enteritidis]|nr:hypothetical protein [Salmonella enterica subsp. enterica serovar Enteritidis]